MIKYLEKEEDFENEIKGNVVVDFYADWCNPCRMLGHVLEEMVEEDSSINVLKINVDKFQSIAFKFNVSSIPSVFIFKDGKQVHDFLGFRGKDELKEIFDKFLK